jgi:hypothetical protein
VIPIVISVALVCFLLVHITPGRSARGCAGGGRVGRARRTIACGLWFRPSAAGAVRPVVVARRQWRSRPFHRDRPPGPDRGHARGRQHRDTRGRSRDDRLYPRPVVRSDRRLFFRDSWVDKLATSFCHRRRLRAALLARHGAGHHLLGGIELAARGRRRSRRLRRLGMGLGASALSDPARDHRVGDPHGYHHPHGARLDRRHPEPRRTRSQSGSSRAYSRAASPSPQARSARRS